MVIENSVRAESAKISSACRQLSAGETDRGTRAAAMQRRAESQSGECRENPVSARDEIALVHKTNGSYRRRGPTNSKRRGVVSMMESSDLRNHYDAPAFWLLHGPRFRSIFGQRQMSSGVLVVGKITSQSPAQRLSFHTIMWSKHSRRTEPINRSTNGFCHGDRGAAITSSIPRPFVISTQSSP